MIFFPNVPPGVNQKFYTKWRPLTVVKMVGRVNVSCTPDNEDKGAKPVLVHVDRVVDRHLGQPEEPEQPAKDVDGPVTRSMRRSVEQIAAMTWAEEADYEEMLQAARLEDEARWEEECLFFEPVRSLRRDMEPRPMKKAESAPDLAEDDPRQADPWFLSLIHI